MAQEYLGAVKLFAGNFPIRGYAVCQGSLLSIQQNAALFAILGTTYGGNGTTNFALPDLRGRLPLGAGQGVGLSPYVLGQIGGAESVQLTTQTSPSHQHSLNATKVSTTTVTAGSGVITGTLNASDGAFYTAPGEAGFTTTPMSANAVTAMGGNQPHNNIQPTMALTYLIALQGIFPSRN